MEIQSSKKFSSPEEEIAYLKNEIAKRERALLERNQAVDQGDIETIGKQVMREYAEHDPHLILARSRVMGPERIASAAESVHLASDRVEELVRLALHEGVRNALSVLEKTGDAFLTDETHRELVQVIRGGRTVADLKEGAPLWNMLHMTLFEVALPRHKDDHADTPLKTVFAGMEQFYAGMQTVSRGSQRLYYSIEIAVADKSDEIIFYVAVPNDFINLFEKQALSLFPHATLIEQRNDYNIFVEGGVSLATVFGLKKHPIHPLKLFDEFENDPLAVILNAFSKIDREGGGAAVQIIIEGGASAYQQSYEGIIKRMAHGEKKEVAIRKSTLGGKMFEEFRSLFKDSNTQKKPETPREVDAKTIELFERKVTSPVLSTNIRLVASARTDARARQILTELEASFNQFESTQGNSFTMKRLHGGELVKELQSFSFREYLPSRVVPLSLRELATLVHFPTEGIESSPQFKQSRAKIAPAPIHLPQYGTLLGENVFRNVATKVYLTPEDRLRHFYVIGQTGVGKTALLKNMIVQDIQAGAGVCMIDPHGTDIVDVLSAIPPERIDDLIYFDPARLERAIGLNMLEFDPAHPEQKTFVVNELFSIFQKLYGAVPESMGPMFEQYFRNATLLVLEDPNSGSTLLDISRVMVDAPYRRYKLSKATNPVVVQFWQQIATKAGGEASLENIVPYITSKFDVFTANDYMRPIIGQQHSSFNFRDIMDNKKILLVNLSKGRLGEINANLIGMIIVGKILMSALSRVDDMTGNFPPFYLYIDEFQNVTTNSIAAILSEARKYKLGLTIAHQFIAQLDDRIRDAVFGNVGSMAVFRVGPEDAAFLEKQFAPTFSAIDLMNIENRNAYVRLLAENVPTPPFSIRTMKPHDRNVEYAEELIEYSLLRFGRARDEVEAEIRARYHM